MKAVQTFWISRPTPLEHLHMGWIDARYHLMGWCLSSLLMKRHFGQVHLVANREGEKVLIGMLGLPYDSVSLALEDTLKEGKAYLLNKVYSHSLHEEPFIHIDGDAFLWKKPSAALLQAPLIGQNIEIDHHVYQGIAQEWKEKGLSMPAFFPDTTKLIAVNTGIVGGQRYDFFKKYYTEASTFAQENAAHIAGLQDVYGMPLILEQAIFKYLADAEGLPITNAMKASFRSEYWHLADFTHFGEEGPLMSHLLGSFRQRLLLCMLVEQWLEHEFPEYHERVEALFPQFAPSQIRLHPDYEAALPAWEYIDHHIGQALSRPFHRTHALLDQKCEVEGPDTLMAQRTRDCISYEKERKRLLERFLKKKEPRPGIRELMRLFGKPMPERVGDRVALLPYAPLLRSRFNWHRPENMEEGHFMYEMILDARTGYMQEFLLNSFSTQICHILRDACTVGELQGKMQEAFPKIPAPQLHYQIDSRLREMFLCGYISYT